MKEPNSTGLHGPLASVADAVDRRRPCRAEYRNPMLIAMLRRASRLRESHLDVVPEADDDHTVSARKAIAFIMLVSVSLWGLIGIGIWSLLG